MFREEIEGLTKVIEVELPGMPSYQRAFNERYNDAIIDVLTIFDKYKIVAEEIIDSSIEQRARLQDQIQFLKHGDTIVILKRGGERGNGKST